MIEEIIQSMARGICVLISSGLICFWIHKRSERELIKPKSYYDRYVLEKKEKEKQAAQRNRMNNG